MKTTPKDSNNPQSSSEFVIPQPGEIWIHKNQGLVKIVRKWNDKESVCEVLRPDRRELLHNIFMSKVLDSTESGAAEV